MAQQETQKIEAEAKQMKTALEKQAPVERGGASLGTLVAPNTPAISSDRGQSYSR